MGTGETIDHVTAYNKFQNVCCKIVFFTLPHHTFKQESSLLSFLNFLEETVSSLYAFILLVSSPYTGDENK